MSTRHDYFMLLFWYSLCHDIPFIYLLCKKKKKPEDKICGRILAVLLEIEDETKFSLKNILLFWNVDLCNNNNKIIFLLMMCLEFNFLKNVFQMICLTNVNL